MKPETAAVITATIAALASIISAIISNRSQKLTVEVDIRARVRQARLDERDLIGKESGFLIPVENDDLWRDYFSKVQQPNVSRKEASESVRAKAPDSTNPLVQGVSSQ